MKKTLRITHYEFNKRYLYQLALLCGKLDISCNRAISEAMRHFSIFLLNEGFNIGRNPATNQINIDKCLDQVSINQLSEQLISTAENEFQKIIRDFQDKKFCALLCDAGAVLKTHCLHFVVTLMGKPVLKIFFDSFDDDVFDTSFYQKSFYKIWEKLQELRIHICSITTDNLPAQVRGWKIFQETIDDLFIKAVLRIPCYAHLINLVFKDAARCSSWLAQTVNSVLAIVKIIRKPEAVNKIRRKCPTISQTRWLYIVDILLFLLSNRIAINNFLQKYTSSLLLINNDMEFAYRLLILLKTYSLIVEKDQFQLFNIIPLTREFFSELKNIYLCVENPDWKDVINIIDCSMRIQILNNSYNETVTAYCLSCRGRAEIREKYKSVRTKCPYSQSKLNQNKD